MDHTPNTALIPTTVDDFQVKFCFVCYPYHAPDKPLHAWMYPCTCTLVAHESCLLCWTHVAQAANALECPQCRTKYELVNNQRRILRVLGLGSLNRAGRIVTLVSAVGIYGAATMYGLWAARQFIGPEMQALLVPDDPDDWRWTTFIALPSIPLTLILNRYPPRHLIPSIISILLLRPPTSADLPTFLHRSATSWGWPPRPAIFGFILFNLVRYVYRKAWKCLQDYILGYVPPSVRNVGDTVVWDEWPVRIRRQINNNGAVQQQQAQGPGQNQTIMVRRSSLGRHIAGALLVPWISNHMGALLLAVSKYSTILRQILAVEPQVQGLLGQLQKMLGVVWHSDMRGSSMWAEADPVWWRNILGLGLFVVVKDAMELLHLWPWDARVVVI